MRDQQQQGQQGQQGHPAAAVRVPPPSASGSESPVLRQRWLLVTRCLRDDWTINYVLEHARSIRMAGFSGAWSVSLTVCCAGPARTQGAEVIAVDAPHNSTNGAVSQRLADVLELVARLLCPDLILLALRGPPVRVFVRDAAGIRPGQHLDRAHSNICLPERTEIVEAGHL